MVRQMKESKIYCTKCDEPMEEVLLPNYEYVEGYPLRNVLAYKCYKCGDIFFTETQVKEMETRTKSIREHIFGFERKVTVSGKSLAITIPHELAKHIGIKQGQKIKIIPVANEGFMIRIFEECCTF